MSSMSVPPESSSAVLVMISSKSVSICNRSRATLVDRSKNRAFWRGTQIWCRTLYGRLLKPKGSKLTRLKLTCLRNHKQGPSNRHASAMKTKCNVAWVTVQGHPRWRSLGSVETIRDKVNTSLLALSEMVFARAHCAVLLQYNCNNLTIYFVLHCINHSTYLNPCDALQVICKFFQTCTKLAFSHNCNTTAIE